MWQFSKVQRALYIEFLILARMQKISLNFLFAAVGGSDFNFYD